MVEHTTTPSANRTIVNIRLKRNTLIIMLLNSNIHTNHVFMRILKLIQRYVHVCMFEY